MDPSNELEVFIGSLGEFQPSFRLLVTSVITLDQLEKIAIMLKQSVDQARQELSNERQYNDSKVICSFCDGDHLDLECPSHT